MKTINIKEIIGDTVRSRRNLGVVLDKEVGERALILLTGVKFISRSAADELVSFMEATDSTMECDSQEVAAMINTVRNSRSVGRRHREAGMRIQTPANIRELKTILSNW